MCKHAASCRLFFFFFFFSGPPRALSKGRNDDDDVLVNVQRLHIFNIPRSTVLHVKCGGRGELRRRMKKKKNILCVPQSRGS